MPPPRRIDRFWAEFLGVDPDRLATPGVAVVAHAALGDYAGVWFFVRETTCIVSAPPAWCDPLRAALREQRLDSLLEPAGLDALFGPALAATIGPAFHGWLEPERFRPRRAAAVREVGAADADAVAALRADCGEAAWHAGDLRTAEPGAFGWFESGALVAAASASPWAPGVVGPGVLCRPAARRRGCGTAVVSAVAERALARGELVVYQTLMENEAARGVAARLGFAFYATHLAVRLTRD